jgi:hypothetical protein
MFSKYSSLPDVVGLITSAIHDKNFFPDGTVFQTVTFKLNDERFVFIVFICCFFNL